MTRPTSAERQQMREYHREVAYRGRCVGCGEDWPCRYIRLLDALDESEQEIARLKVLVAWSRGGITDREAFFRGAGYPGPAWREYFAWVHDIVTEGVALVQAAGEGEHE